MARIIKHGVEATGFGFLSTGLFLLTFLLAGDVLISALVAVAAAITQIVLRKSAHEKTGVLVWASLALVIALTGLSITGAEADAAFAPTVVSAVNANDIKPVCVCHMTQSLDANQALLTSKPVKFASVQ